MTIVTSPIDTLMTYGTTKIQHWWPWWQVVTTCDDHCDEQVMTLKIKWQHLMTSDDSSWQLLLPKSKVACLADMKNLIWAMLVKGWHFSMPTDNYVIYQCKTWESKYMLWTMNTNIFTYLDVMIVIKVIMWYTCPRHVKMSASPRFYIYSLCSHRSGFVLTWFCVIFITTQHHTSRLVMAYELA